MDGTLTRLDPLTLKPRGPSVELPEYHSNWSFSPSGSLVALGMGSPGTPTCGAGLCIVDVDSMRLSQDIDAPVAVQAIGWVSPRRIAAVTQRGLILVADPVTGEIVRQRNLGAETILPRSALAGGTFVVLVGGDFLRLVAVDAKGSIRVARLGGLGPLSPSATGVTIDPATGRALVFAAGARAAEVDLGTMAVRYHRLRAGPGPGSSRRSARPCAAWLGHGRAVVFGDSVQVVDTGTWTTRSLGGRSDQASVADGRLLAYSSRYTETRRGAGLRIYSLRGRSLISHRFANQRLNLQVAGPLAYALDRRMVRSVRIRDGKLVDAARQRTSGYTRILGARSGSGGCE